MGERVELVELVGRSLLDLEAQRDEDRFGLVHEALRKIRVGVHVLQERIRPHLDQLELRWIEHGASYTGPVVRVSRLCIAPLACGRIYSAVLAARPARNVRAHQIRSSSISSAACARCGKSANVLPCSSMSTNSPRMT